MTLDELTENALWWHGPPWLNSLELPWPAKYTPTKTSAIEDSEARKVVVLPAIENDLSNNLLSRYSNLRPLLRISALIRRFRENCNRRKHSRDPLVGPLTISELDHALIALIRQAQQEHFEKEIHQLSSSGRVDHKSKLRFLHPELVDGVIRVGGRLHNAQLPIEGKHPIVLPAQHRLTELIVTREHHKTLHAGPGLLLSTLRQKFWPLGGRNLVRQTVHRCITCTRARPKLFEQLMGQLPPVRVNQAYPFENVGVDLAGPLYVRPPTRSRNASLIKSYIVVYVCLVTKAAHLELVSELTTAAFIASLRRFTGRRGKPAHIYCDNATNFVGARRELEELRKLFLSQQHKESVAGECVEDGIQFHFIPPRSPSFGGIWEACVKSVKNLLRKILGNAHLTMCELQTALVQVEAMLNSRPITPLPDNPSEEQALTPGHFLIFRPLNAIPEPDEHSVPENRLSRYRRVQKLTGHFWSRWHKEYLNTLQARYRWIHELDSLAVGSIVILKEEKVPPLKWPLGRVLSVHPGNDGLVRVATVKTQAGITQRAVSKLCLLPIEGDPAVVSPSAANLSEHGHWSGNTSAGQGDPALAQGTEPQDELPVPTRGNETPDEILAQARGNRAVPGASVMS